MTAEAADKIGAKVRRIEGLASKSLADQEALIAAATGTGSSPAAGTNEK
jgi:hypothetical protein